ncbi:MAG: proton-conducting transporter membrane subunit, partial [Thermoanaerobaculia bacterium]
MTLVPQLEPNWVLAILPEIVLTVTGIIIILLQAFLPKVRNGMASLGIISLLGALASELWAQNGVFFGGTYSVSPLTKFFDFVFIVAAILASMYSRDYMAREKIQGGEFYALLLWATAGMMMMSKGLDLLIVILGLEMLSICIFVLVGYHRALPISNEASLKYFLMGAFATGFILYGTALFYGASGSTNVDVLAKYTAGLTSVSPMLTIAFVLLIAGFGFKLALFPFHAWAPDVYQGAPSPVSGWLSVAP